MQIYLFIKLIYNFLQTEDKNQKYLYVKPELGLMYPGADHVSEYIKKKYNENGKLPIVLDCNNILKLDYSAAKVRM